MAYGGVDVGAATAKAVILDGEGLSRYFFVMSTGYDVKVAADKVMEEALARAGLPMEAIDCVFSTGYGRKAVSFAKKSISEIMCHAKGAFAINPETRSIIDIGGQDSKVIKIDGTGRVVDFVMNDKCAAGTGRFLEVMAGVLDISLDDLGPTSLLSGDPCRITNTCTVFAETEVVSLRAQGSTRENIVAGIHKAAASRVGIMGRSVGLQREVMFTGGVAKNIGIKKAIEIECGFELVLPNEPQIIGALGAAIMARENA